MSLPLGSPPQIQNVANLREPCTCTLGAAECSVPAIGSPPTGTVQQLQKKLLNSRILAPGRINLPGIYGRSSRVLLATVPVVLPAVPPLYTLLY